MLHRQHALEATADKRGRQPVSPLSVSASCVTPTPLSGAAGPGALDLDPPWLNRFGEHPPCRHLPCASASCSSHPSRAEPTQATSAGIRPSEKGFTNQCHNLAFQARQNCRKSRFLNTGSRRTASARLGLGVKSLLPASPWGNHRGSRRELSLSPGRAPPDPAPRSGGRSRGDGRRRRAETPPRFEKEPRRPGPPLAPPTGPATGNRPPPAPPPSPGNGAALSRDGGPGPSPGERAGADKLTASGAATALTRALRRRTGRTGPVAPAPPRGAQLRARPAPGSGSGTARHGTARRPRRWGGSRCLTRCRIRLNMVVERGCRRAAAARPKGSRGAPRSAAPAPQEPGAARSPRDSRRGRRGEAGQAPRSAPGRGGARGDGAAVTARPPGAGKATRGGGAECAGPGRDGVGSAPRSLRGGPGPAPPRRSRCVPVLCPPSWLPSAVRERTEGRPCLCPRPSAVLPSGAAPGSRQLRARSYWHQSGIGREKEKDCVV